MRRLALILALVPVVAGCVPDESETNIEPATPSTVTVPVASTALSSRDSDDAPPAGSAEQNVLERDVDQLVQEYEEIEAEYEHARRFCEETGDAAQCQKAESLLRQLDSFSP